MCHALAFVCYCLLLIEILVSASYDHVCPDLVHVLIAERICFSAGVEEARGSETSFSSLMQNIKHNVRFHE